MALTITLSRINSDFTTKHYFIPRSEQSSEENDWEDEQDSNYFDNNMSDFSQEDQEIMNNVLNREKFSTTESTTTKPHRRHLHKHPYDRGPM